MHKNGNIVYELSSISQNNEEVFFRKGFFWETIAKNRRNPDLELTTELATRFKEWMPLMQEVRIEQGIHHNFSFKVFECTFEGHRLQLKAKRTEGLIAHNFKIL